MSVTAELVPTAKLRFVKRGTKMVLQQWWSNAANVKMGPTQMIKGEWRDVPLEDE
jgi:hypothetical protein